MQNSRHVTDVTTLNVSIATREEDINLIECKGVWSNPVTCVTLLRFSQLCQNLIRYLRNHCINDSFISLFSVTNWEAYCSIIDSAKYPAKSLTDVFEVFRLW